MIARYADRQPIPEARRPPRPPTRKSRLGVAGFDPLWLGAGSTTRRLRVPPPGRIHSGSETRLVGCGRAATIAPSPRAEDRCSFSYARGAGGRVDHFAVPGRSAGARPSDVRERGSAPGADGLGHVSPVDPEPWGPPWRGWEEVDPDEAGGSGCPRARSTHCPTPRPGAIVIAPRRRPAARRRFPDRCAGSCLRPSTGGERPQHGPARRATLPVATRIDDCAHWQAVWFMPDAVHRLPVDGFESARSSWGRVDGRDGGKRLRSSRSPRGGFAERAWGHFWSVGAREWEAVAGRALAHLLVGPPRAGR